MSRTTTMPKRNFSEMDADAIATIVEQDIKSLARRRKNKVRKDARVALATKTAALYLQANRALYVRETIPDTRNAHESWMALMREWFFDIDKQTKIE